MEDSYHRKNKELCADFGYYRWPIFGYNSLFSDPPTRSYLMVWMVPQPGPNHQHEGCMKSEFGLICCREFCGQKAEWVPMK